MSIIVDMKKFFLFVVAIILILFIMHTPFSLESVADLNLQNKVTFTFYTTDSDLSFPYAQIVSNGSAKIVSMDISYASTARGNFKKIDGESFSVSGTEEEFIKVKNYFIQTLVKQEDVGDIKCFYGYNSKLKYNSVIDGKKINVQVVYSGGKIVVGSPVILGSY